MLLIMASIPAFAQKEKWFVSFSAGAGIGGPSASIKSQMKKQGFDQTADYNFFGLSGSTSYPRKEAGGTFLLRFGKRMDARRSLYFIVGQTDKAEVSGFKNQGSSSFLGIIGGSYGPFPQVQYKVWQVTGGFLFQTSSCAKLGIGPSVFVIPYSLSNATGFAYKHTSVMAGASLSARLPVGRERRQFGMDFMVDVNLAPPVSMKIDGESADGFHMKRANLIHASAGLAFTFRKLK